jgi:hypothetical protein
LNYPFFSLNDPLTPLRSITWRSMRTVFLKRNGGSSKNIQINAPLNDLVRFLSDVLKEQEDLIFSSWTLIFSRSINLSGTQTETNKECILQKTFDSDGVLSRSLYILNPVIREFVIYFLWQFFDLLQNSDISSRLPTSSSSAGNVGLRAGWKNINLLFSIFFMFFTRRIIAVAFSNWIEYQVTIQIFWNYEDHINLL